MIKWKISKLAGQGGKQMPKIRVHRRMDINVAISFLKEFIGEDSHQLQGMFIGGFGFVGLEAYIHILEFGNLGLEYA